MIALMLTLFLSAEPRPEPMPGFSVKLRKAEDKLVVSRGKSGTLWKITSKSGIGGAEVTLDRGPAPTKITIRFVGMKSLESFSMRDGLIRLSARLGRDLYFDDKGVLTTKEMDSIGSLHVVKTKTGIDVVLTSRKPGKQWKFSWVDAFRR